MSDTVLPDYSDWLTPERLMAEEELWQDPASRSWPVFVEGLGRLAEHVEIHSIAEFGCGTGLVPAALAPETDYVGVDANPFCIELAQKRNPQRKFTVGDIRTVELPQFTVACSFAVLKHFGLHEWDSILARVLQHADWGLFSMPIGAEVYDDGIDFPHVWVTRERLEQAVLAAGHELVDISALSFGDESMVLTRRTTILEGGVVHEQQQLLPRCLCGAPDAVATVMHDTPVLQCAVCGIVRQAISLSAKAVAEWYRRRYHAGRYQHTYEHDVAVAKLRLTAYAFSSNTRLLDVGCGNSAFVDAARSGGLDAWGQDLARQSDGTFTYVGALEDISFPTDSFDAVTLHDVLEHFPQPQAALAEVARVLRPGGRLIVDFPRFYHDLGKHHWKLIEHLWMLNEEQLMALIEKSGFTIEKWYNPIASKIVVWATRRVEKRPQVLVPSGIGDAYWVMAKLPGFLKVRGLGLPDVWVQDAEKGLKRTQPFLQTIPFVHAAGYKLWKPQDPIFHEAYMRDGRTVFEKVLGVDYFIAYNGVMRYGKNLEQVDPEYGCEWFPRMHVSKTTAAYQAQLVAGGPYAVVYFVAHGMYSNWIADFGIDQLQASLVAIRAQLGLRLVLIGAKWDEGSLGDKMAQRNPEWTNLVGKTSYEEMQGALQGASLVFGYPSGASILGAVFRRPTVLLWNKYFQQPFWTNAVPPNTPYRALDTAGLSVDAILTAAREVLDAG